MIRTITGFHADGNGEWVAELSCYHQQHVRHRPPFQERAWVVDPEGRAAQIGATIDCALCDRAEFPDGLTLLGRAGPWDQDSLPGGLKGAHRTAEGRWGRLRVLDGTVDFRFETPDVPGSSALHLEAGSLQPIPPGTPHRIILSGPVSLELEFWGRPA